MIILGSTGAIGRSFTKLLDEKKIPYQTPKYDWLYGDLLNDCLDWSSDDIIINLTGVKTNLFLNESKPATICSNTLLTNINILNMAKSYGVKKIINIISSCAYPGNILEPMKEDIFWSAPVHESVRPHGLAKKVVYGLSQYYRKEHNLNVVCLAMNSIYGGFPSWDKPNTLKVLEALVKKFVDAKNKDLKSISLYGAGLAYREFLHADDAAEAILLASQTYDGELLNVGCGHDVLIKDLAEGIKLAVGFKGDIVWGMEPEQSQYKKLLSIENMMQKLKWFPRIPLVEGIEQTINSYNDFIGASK